MSFFVTSTLVISKCKTECSACSFQTQDKVGIMSNKDWIKPQASNGV